MQYININKKNFQLPRNELCQGRRGILRNGFLLFEHVCCTVFYYNIQIDRRVWPVRGRPGNKFRERPVGRRDRGIPVFGGIDFSRQPGRRVHGNTGLFGVRIVVSALSAAFADQSQSEVRLG